MHPTVKETWRFLCVDLVTKHFIHIWNSNYRTIIKWQHSVNYLMVKKSPKIFGTVITIILTNVTAWTYTFFSDSTSSAALSRTLLTPHLERFHKCLVFHKPPSILHGFKNLWYGCWLNPCFVRLWFCTSIHLVHSSLINALNGVCVCWDVQWL